MKKMLFVALAALVLSSCGGEKNASYTITGKVAQPELEGKQVLLGQYEGREVRAFDTAVIAKGAYEFKGSFAMPELYVVSIDRGEEQRPLRIQFIGENAAISITSDSTGNRSVGSPLNDIFQAYKDKVADTHVKTGALRDTYKAQEEAGMLTAEVKDSLNVEFEKLNKERELYTIDFVKANINNVAGQSQIGQLGGLPIEELKVLIAGADSAALQSRYVKKISDRITALENVAVGKPYVDLRMPGIDGKEVALSDYVGKSEYVLVDFWASWCPDCRKEIPNLIAAYKKYKDKGLEIVGVSFDKEKDAWVKGVEDLKMTWPQMSDLAYWNSEAVAKYGIYSIPHTVLIGKDGTIVAKNLSGDELSKKLAELFN